MWRRSVQLGGREQIEGFTAVCGGGLLSLEVRTRLRGLQLCVGGGGVYEKINSEKGRETMCLRGGGGVKRRRNILGEVYKSFFCYGAGAENK